jgi:hypothetical protein
MGKSVFPLAEGQTTENIERMAVRRVINLQVGMMVAVVLWLFFAVGASLLTGPRSEAPRVATLTQVQGTVDILIADGSTWQPVEVDTQIEAGTRVRTGPDTTAQLAFFDGSTTDLASDTEVSIVQMSSLKKGQGKVIILQQRAGQTYHRVQPLLDADSRFEVETPSAVASVRGTEFVLDVEFDGATQVVVVEGLVNVEAQEVVIPVEAGHGTVARPQQPPEPARPVPILPAQVESPASTEVPEPTKAPVPAEIEPIATSELGKPKPTKEPEPIRESKPVESPRPTQEPRPTETPEPVEPTETPKPTETPEPVKPIEEPKPTPTPEPVKPTQEPKPTQKPHPTQKPKPTKKPKPIKPKKP